MKEQFISKLQKFISVPFTYENLCIVIDKQRDFLLTKNIMDKTEPNELNALWHTLDDLKEYFSFANEKGVVIVTQVSVLLIFDINIKWIKKAMNK
ncbi:MAG: hypothetical protein V4547_19535 [Bacteroidota bacterium]